MAFTISDHTLDKHLYNSHKFDGASVFISKDIMIFCVQECVKRVDTKCRLNTKQALEYKFNFVVGFMSNGKTVSKVRMIYKQQQRRIFVITIYPVK